MPTKKAAPAKTAAAAKKAAAPASHASYKDMIKDAILSLKDRNGSSRQAIKKYVLANNTLNTTSKAFDSLFNRSVKTGVDAGDFTQPKGPSGPVKLAKKDASRSAAKKTTTTVKKDAPATKEPAAKKDKDSAPAKKETAAAKKTAAAATASKKEAASKKAATTTTTKTKANASRPRKTSTAAPAVVDKPTVVTQTKSGRVTKGPAKPEVKKAPVKKTSTAAAKKASGAAAKKRGAAAAAAADATSADSGPATAREA
ncbi:MAG: hypothetical protein M1826_006452 [Phylliscum demangeonii]|nr:MAG: hypothetical protein M1826_006452 [Phylliscum demangeonii]